MAQDEKLQKAIRLLTEASAELGRTPKRSDFDSETACFIKQKLGPWPRALEAAGLKEPPAVSAKEKTVLKRERARARRKEAKRNERLKENEQAGSVISVGDDSHAGAVSAERESCGNR